MSSPVVSGDKPPAHADSKLHHLFRRSSHHLMNKLHSSSSSTVTSNKQSPSSPTEDPSNPGSGASGGSSSSTVDQHGASQKKPARNQSIKQKAALPKSSSNVARASSLSHKQSTPTRPKLSTALSTPVPHSINNPSATTSTTTPAKSPAKIPVSPRSNSSCSSSDIFERGATSPFSLVSGLSSNLNSKNANSRTLSIASNNSSLSNYTPSAYSIPSHHNMTDFVAPVLDSTAEIITDPKVDLNDVELVCCQDNHSNSSFEDYDDDAHSVNELYYPQGYNNDDIENFVDAKSNLDYTTPAPPPSSTRDNSRKPCACKSSSALSNSAPHQRSRSRSRSRSIISTSLLNSISTGPSSSSSNSNTNLKRSSKSATSLYSRPPPPPQITTNQSQQQSHADSITGKLWSHQQQHQHHQKNHSHHQQSQPASPAKTTINFYSFADMCSKESQSATSPTSTRRSSNSHGFKPEDTLSHADDEQIKTFGGYSMKPVSHDDRLAPLNTDLRNGSTGSLSPDGYTSIRMKDYISNP